MTTTLPPEYDMANTLSTQMPSQISRHPSRSSGCPSGYRPSRVEKPKSNHNSPRALERRKTTSGSKRYATLDDHFNMMFGINGEEAEAEAEQNQYQSQPARPMSWHPSSQPQGTYEPAMLPVQTSGQDWSRHSAYGSTYGSDFYSLSARSPMYPEQFQNYCAYTPSIDNRHSQASECSWYTPQYTMSAYSTPSTEPMSWYPNQWTQNNEADMSSSQNASSDFLPIQHPPTTQPLSVNDKDYRDPGKELVALGLYHRGEPASTPGFPSLLEGTGKGLTLEETWQPPEEKDESEDEDADAETEESSSDDGSIDELPAPQQAAPLPVSSDKARIPSNCNLQGQSFFFEEDDNCANEWWCQTLRQPTMPMPMSVQDAGLGCRYGWYDHS